MSAARRIGITWLHRYMGFLCINFAKFSSEIHSWQFCSMSSCNSSRDIFFLTEGAILASEVATFSSFELSTFGFELSTFGFELSTFGSKLSTYGFELSTFGAEL